MFCFIIKLCIVYLIITGLTFVKNCYRMTHTNYLRNTYRHNLHHGNPNVNRELIQPLNNIFHKAHIQICEQEIEDAVVRNYHISEFENNLEKAFRYYKYLMKSCFLWITRLPIPKYRSIGKIPSKILQILVSFISILIEYLLCLWLDKSGFGETLLNHLSSLLK